MVVLVARKAAAEGGGGGGFSFNMTAGDFGGFFQGYSQTGPTGSIDAEPISGHDLVNLLSGGVDNIAFEGDASATLAGLTVWVDGAEYPFDSQDWAYAAGDNTTSGAWASAGPVFVNTVSYFVEIK